MRIFQLVVHVSSATPRFQLNRTLPHDGLHVHRNWTCSELCCATYRSQIGGIDYYTQQHRPSLLGVVSRNNSTQRRVEIFFVVRLHLRLYCYNKRHREGFQLVGRTHSSSNFTDLIVLRYSVPKNR